MNYNDITIKHNELQWKDMREWDMPHMTNSNQDYASWVCPEMWYTTIHCLSTMGQWYPKHSQKNHWKMGYLWVPYFETNSHWVISTWDYPLWLGNSQSSNRQSTFCWVAEKQKNVLLGCPKKELSSGECREFSVAQEILLLGVPEQPKAQGDYHTVSEQLVVSVSYISDWWF